MKGITTHPRTFVECGSKIVLILILALCMAALPSLSWAEALDTDNANVSTEQTGGNTAADDCTVTLEYYENVPYDEFDPMFPPNEEGRFLLGTRVLTGLHEGDFIRTVDYIANIPGYFFFDAWPARLTVSTNPAENVIKLFYFKRYESEYTVNYYIMTGADLAADTWSGALATGDVDFYKMGSQTFHNKRFLSLINGDAYEYKLDDMYVVDSYPAQIRLGLNADDNVLNVLYVPALTNLPTETPVPDDTNAPDNTLPPTAPDTPNTPDVPSTPDNGGGNGGITDDMMNNPVSKGELVEAADQYLADYMVGKSLAQTGDTTTIIGFVLIALAAIAVGAVAFVQYRQRRQ